MNRVGKTEHFRRLHQRETPLLVPNPWDLGSLRILERLGFGALATTSLGVALAAGRVQAGEAALLRNCRELCSATELPVTLDFEHGFVDSPEGIAAKLPHIYDTGAVGFSIEDSTGRRDEPIYAFERAGADVLYAPYIRELAVMREVIAAVSKPLNVVMGFGDPAITLGDLAAVGARRISIGGGFCRLAMQALEHAATMMRAGDFRFVAELAPLAALTGNFDAGDGR